MSAAGRIFNFSTATAPESYTRYNYAFTANDIITTLTFGMQANEDDENYWLLDNVSVNRTNTNANVLVNGNFELGSLTGWTQYCATGSNCGGGSNVGQITSSSCFMGSFCYVSKCDTGTRYDYLSQSFSTVIGESYVISFHLRVKDAGDNRRAYVLLT